LIVLKRQLKLLFLEEFAGFKEELHGFTPIAVSRLWRIVHVLVRLCSRVRGPGWDGGGDRSLWGRLACVSRLRQAPARCEYQQKPRCERMQQARGVGSAVSWSG